MSKKSRARRRARRGRRWLPLAALAGLALALLAIILAAQAQGSSGTPPAAPQPTKADVVPAPSASPTLRPSPTPTQQTIPHIISNVQPVQVPPLDVTSVSATATSTTRQLQCLPLEFQSYLIRATITVANPIGGAVTYHWQSSDGFVSPNETVWFAPGQRSAVVSDTWTLGAANATGLHRWEEAVVTAPETLVSNRASFVYTCPPMIANMYVEAVQTAGDCSPTGAQYEVFAPVTIFAPAGGTVDFEWQNSDSSGTWTQVGTLRIKPGYVFVNVVAYWQIGNDQNPAGGGVKVVDGNTVLKTSPVTTGGCLPAPVTSQDHNITISGTAATPNLPTGDQGIFSCPTPGTPLVLTTDGQIAFTASQPGTITYYWQRSDGTSTTPVTVNVAADQTPGAGQVLDVRDAWTPKPNHSNVPYSDVLVVTQVDGAALQSGGADAPIQSNAAFFPDFCA